MEIKLLLVILAGVFHLYGSQVLLVLACPSSRGGRGRAVVSSR